MENQSRREPLARRTLDRRESVHVRLPVALADRLRDAAERIGVSRSLVAREAIERGMRAAVDALRAKARRDDARQTGGEA